MTGLTDFITRARWIDIITIWYVLVDDAYRLLEAEYGRWRRRGEPPSFSDSEVITIALLIDTFFHGHEDLGLAFVRQYHRDLFPKLLPAGQFNQRRRQLSVITEHVRQAIGATWGLVDPADPIRLLDTAPIPACTYARAGDNQTLAGAEHFGIMKSRGAKLFGWRLYLSTTSALVPDAWQLAPAAPHEGKLVADFLVDRHDLDMYADGAFHDPEAEAHLRRTRNVRLWATPRKDSRTPWPPAFRKLATRLRRRIETALSILVTVFDIERLGSRSLSGAVARVATRMLAYTLIFVTGPLLAQLS